MLPKIPDKASWTLSSGDKDRNAAIVGAIMMYRFQSRRGIKRCDRCKERRIVRGDQVRIMSYLGLLKVELIGGCFSKENPRLARSGNFISL